MRKRSSVLLAVAAAAAVAVPTVAPAQEYGGVLKPYNRENPPSGSIHEEATNSTVMPYAVVFNNLIEFDPKEPINEIDTIIPDLATEWSWDETNTKLTFTLHEGVKWHDGKPFTAEDVKCTWDMLQGKSETKFRKNPRRIWYHNLDSVSVNSPTSVTFNMKRPQPAFVMMLASGLSPVYPCHVSPDQMRTNPIGTGPFKFVSLESNQSITFVKNEDYFKEGLPYLDGIEWTIISSRPTRILAFSAGEFDVTYVNDVTIPLVKDVKDQAPDAICEVVQTNVSQNVIVNPDAPPFDNPKIRTAMALAFDRDEAIDILSDGQFKKGGAMLPAPEGLWAMPDEMLKELPGYNPDVEGNREKARAIMAELGYTQDNPLKITIPTRNGEQFRDTAVLLIEQLKSIYIEGELEIVESSQWFPKLARKDFQIGMNRTGVSIDDPDVNFFENYMCSSERNYTQYCNPEVEAMIAKQSEIADFEERRKIVWEIDKKLQEDVARPILFYDAAATCWQPWVKGFAMHQNSIFNAWRQFEHVWLDK